jgi:integrase/recombinase XerD
MTKIVKRPPAQPTPPARVSPALVYIEGLPSENSRPAMRNALKSVAAILGDAPWEKVPWHKLDYEHLAVVHARIVEAYRPRTANRVFAALRGVLKASWGMQLIDHEQLERLQATLKGVPVSKLPPGRRITLSEARRLTVACASPRDAALIAILYGAGLRRIEVFRLTRAHYDGVSVLARGKLNKERLVPVFPSWRIFIDAWARELGADAPLIPRLRGTRPTKDAVTPAAMNCLLEAIRVRAGIEPFTPHDFRRSFATNLLDAGVDLATVQKLMGHENINTTTIYDYRDESTKVAAVEKVDAILRGRE